MANLLWGKVYRNNAFAGFLREEPGGRVSFTYDASYYDPAHGAAGYPAISHTLPIGHTLSEAAQPHICEDGLHPFFDNLASEGWLENAQNRLLGKRGAKRFELLLAFGVDGVGAVSVVDPEPADLEGRLEVISDPKEKIALASRSSISGVQPKFFAVEENGGFRASRVNEVSTHIAKLPSASLPGIIENECLTTAAFSALLPGDEVVECGIGSIEGVDEPVLLVKRFDRRRVDPETGGETESQTTERVHFEEFNQLLDRRSNAKYDGAYKDMADFIAKTDGCLPSQNFVLFRRILGGLLLGNMDMHLKNFAMFHTSEGMRLTPSYDQVATVLYGDNTSALSIAGASGVSVGSLKPRNIVLLGEEFGLPTKAIAMAVDQLAGRLEAARRAITDGKHGSDQLKSDLMRIMEKRWNGTFDSIGRELSLKP